ncbi:caspase family protein [Nocardia uniformis]|uniref:Caspase family protein n=1 Tax=Nocardia uniformis TaxID=53432 RepID=A0A849CDG7_9NOCA|nr:caspase family protein [Nocardia uniformis]NNH76026.1 caspase family protein [Nocardia uniformis]
MDLSRAVLIGVGQYDTGEQVTASAVSSALAPLDSVANNLADLQELLTDPDQGTFAARHCALVENPRSPGEIGSVVATAAHSAEDVLFVYYSGHGLIDSRGRLFLALPGSRSDQISWTSLPFETLREAIIDSPAKVRILILDCCFSGRAFESMGEEETAIAGQTEINGTFTITSSAANEPSFAPAGEKNTAFTAALLSAAWASPGITLDELYRDTKRNLASLSRPQPHRRAVNVAGDLVIFGHPEQRPATAEESGNSQSNEAFRANEARRVVASVDPNDLAPNLWNVTVHNGSATPITSLKVEVYPVEVNSATDADLTLECLPAKNQPTLRRAIDDFLRTKMQAGLGQQLPYGYGAMVTDYLAPQLNSAVKQKMLDHMADSFPEVLEAGADASVVYLAPNASSIQADITFVDTDGHTWTRPHGELPRTT